MAVVVQENTFSTILPRDACAQERRLVICLSVLCHSERMNIASYFFIMAVSIKSSPTELWRTAHGAHLRLLNSVILSLSSILFTGSIVSINEYIEYEPLIHIVLTASQCWNWPKRTGASAAEMFEILPRDWNLKPIFTQKWASVYTNWGFNPLATWSL